MAEYIRTIRTTTGDKQIDYEALANKPEIRPKTVKITLTAAGWDTTSKTQTVTATGVLADETVQLITPTPALSSQTAYYDAGILCTGQATDILTFTANTVPTSDLEVYVVIQDVVPPPRTIINFYIDSVSYQAEEGMTWGEWADSEYDTNDNFFSNIPWGSDVAFIYVKNMEGYSEQTLVSEIDGSAITGNDRIISCMDYTLFDPQNDNH